MLKKLIYFISLTVLLNLTYLSYAEIIPLKKPSQTQKQEEKKLLADILKPLPKPIEKKEIKIKEDKVEKKIVTKKESKQGLILPKKKPLIAGSKTTDTIKKSKYYNKKDFEIAKKAISEMKQAKWSTALKTAKKQRINLYIISFNGDIC